jgi:hypothetical protein
MVAAVDRGLFADRCRTTRAPYTICADATVGVSGLPDRGATNPRIPVKRGLRRGVATPAMGHR